MGGNLRVERMAQARSKRTWPSSTRASGPFTVGMLRLLGVQAAGFYGASLVHFGALGPAFVHARARIPEAVIGSVLLLGLFGARLWPERARQLAMASQAFALFGTCVGLAMIAIGVGPHTAGDLAFHASMVALLLIGLRLATMLHTQPDAKSSATRESL